MMRHLRNSMLPAIALCLAASGTGHAFDAATAQEKLHRMLLPHMFRGERITDEMRAATGDPAIPVIDRRKFGDISMCSYIYQRGYFQGRVIICE